MPRLVRPSKKSTVPVGVPGPRREGGNGGGERHRLAEDAGVGGGGQGGGVSAGLTTWLIDGDIALAVKLLSPLV